MTSCDGLRSAVLVLAILNCTTAIANAQDPRVYVGGAFTISSWSIQNVSAGTPNLTFTNTGDNSPAAGIVGEAGLFVSPRVAIGVEIGQAFRKGLTQTHGYINPYVLESQYRDLTLFGVVRYQLNMGRVRAALVGGAGPVQESSLERAASGRYGSTLATVVYDPFGPETEVTNWTFGATFGADIIIKATRHLSVVPQVRVLTIPRGDFEGGPASVSFGLSAVVYRAGIGVRVAF
jgi:hypothetical protein